VTTFYKSTTPHSHSPFLIFRFLCYLPETFLLWLCQDAHSKSAFTAAECWGTFSQKKTGKQQEHRLAVKFGKLMLRKVSLEKTDKIKAVDVSLDGKSIASNFSQQGASVVIELDQQLVINAGQQIYIII
jgi:non-lysosomal glucosylceramidase